MRGNGMTPRTAAVIGWMLLAPICAQAIEDYTDADAALLPTWCEVYRKTGNLRPSDTKDPMLASKLAAFRRLGCGGHHHYCWALATANRAYFSPGDNPNARTWAIDAALGDFGYVLKNSSKTCPLVPDMHVKAGEWETMVGRYKKAEGRFREAIGIKPDYAPAYIGLSDLFETLGKNDAALAALQAGIKANPQSSALKKKLGRLQKRLAGESPSPAVSGR